MATQTEPPRRAGASRGRPNLPLLQARIRAGMSRRDVADASGITEKQVGLIERGVAVHSRAETLAAIAEALDLDVFELFPARRTPTRRRRSAA